MTTYRKPLVDIPDDKGVHVKTAGAKSEMYVYKYVKYYRNDQGNPRNKAKAIGKLDPETGRMVPNSNYFQMYHLDPLLPDITIWKYGYTYLILKVCKDIKLLDCLTRVFGERAIDIIVMASYIIRKGNAMDGIDDWQQENYFPGFERLLTSQSTSRIFGTLSAVKMNDFFKHWIQEAFHGGSVFYDVTSISSYSQEMPDVEYGYNRDGEDLAQFNVGLFCDESTRTPLYYNRYNGSLTDKVNLSYVLKNAESVGIKNIKAVVDGGFWSEECIKSLNSCCDTFTIGMPAFLKESQKILSEYADGIEKYENELIEYHVYCVEVNTTLYGVPGKVLLYYDPWNHLNLCNEMSERINKLKSELSALKRYPKSKLSRYTKYFIITKHENDNGFDFMVDTDNVEQLRKYKGFFPIFTTDMNATPSDNLYFYRTKDVEEKLFDQIKVDMDGGRIRTHSMEATEGKTFVTFIACVIRSYMFNKLSKHFTENSTSLKKVLNKLSNITIISSYDGYRFTKALTKEQKDILSAFDAVNDIKVSVKNEKCLR
ncbi:MAG TPA: hypothetical protein DDZ89_13500 [Clostridiales bacterium]|nr:hypothetical protein [Clostridiales bacterium]